jgi:DNA polymerase-3 subunit alpha
LCNFGHLHTHSEYSTLDGMGKVRELLTTAKELGQDFIAITDHGSTSGLYEAQKVADEIGIKLIHGIEFYYEREGDGKNGHLLVLAKSNRGLENIFKMQKHSSRHNFYKKPRINWDILQEHAEGLVVTSTCLGSAFNQLILQGDITGAIEWATKFKEVFGDDFYIELQPNSIPEQHTCNVASIRIAKKLGIKMVATNDVHYTFEDDCFPHEVLLALQMKRKMADEKRFKFSTDDFWLKSEEEMYETFKGIDEEVVREAILNTREIADKCDSRIEKGHYLPTYYNIPEGETERSLLVKHTKDGIVSRNTRDKQFIKEVQHEIDVIDRNGYSGYFLIVQDYVNSAKERGELVGEGRGSGAGSKVAFLTKITEIAPHEYDLLFERFMADGRSPDFDVDFSDQGAVFRDLQSKYGTDNVSRIIAFGRMTPRAVVRKVFNCFGHSMALQSEITKLVPDLCKSLKDAYEYSPSLLDYKKQYPTEWDVIERLENVISHESQHAGGVLIYEGLGDIVPLKWDRDEEIFVATWDKYMLEDLGHYKFDVLGLITLPILHGALESARASGHKIDLTKIDLEDKRVYDMLCKGDVSGVFQINNQAGKVIQQQPRNFRDLIAINALIRPGTGDWDEYIARRSGKHWEVHPDRLPYMQETEGLITYQEQFLLDCKTLAGWDIAFADKKVRKNKDIRNDVELRSKFYEDCVSRGYDHELAISVWQEIEHSVAGGYSFNKSHSASYAMLSYQTAYLKCHYPQHFYASLMSGAKTDGDGQNEIAGYIAECKQRGITILPPDINSGGTNFVASDRGIHYRITTIKHVGESAVEWIMDNRPFASFDDFLARRVTNKVNKACVVNLIKAGAFDSLNPNRDVLMWEFDMSQRKKTDIKNGVETPRYEYDDKVKMLWEKEVLGMYLSAHPMERYGFKNIEEYEDGKVALQGGEIAEVYAFHPQKNPAKPKMAWVTINTLFGNVKVVVFAREYARADVQDMFQKGNIVLVKGTRQGREILYNSGEVLEQAN